MFTIRSLGKLMRNFIETYKSLWKTRLENSEKSDLNDNQKDAVRFACKVVCNDMDSLALNKKSKRLSL